MSRKSTRPLTGKPTQQPVMATDGACVGAERGVSPGTPATALTSCDRACLNTGDMHDGPITRSFIAAEEPASTSSGEQLARMQVRPLPSAATASWERANKPGPQDLHRTRPDSATTTTVLPRIVGADITVPRRFAAGLGQLASVEAEALELRKWERQPLESCKAAAHRGSPAAQVAAARKTLQGSGQSKGSIQEAISWLRRAAKHGSPEAHFQLGKAYFRGRGVLKDLNQSCFHFSAAGKLGHVRALADLARATILQYPASADQIESAIQALHLAARRDCPTAKHRLGLCYQYGLGLDANHSAAMQLLLDSADSGEQLAVWSAAVLASHTGGLGPDLLLRLEKILARYPRSGALLASALQADQKGERRIAALELASASEDIEAMLALGETLADSAEETERVRGLELLVAAQQAGCRRAGILLVDKAGTALGLTPLPGDATLSACLLARSPVQIPPEAPNLLSCVSSLSLEFLAATGNEKAMLELGELRRTASKGKQRKLAEAAQWYSRAAEAGSGKALFQLHVLKSGGEVARASHRSEPREAEELLQTAATRGCAEAQLELGKQLIHHDSQPSGTEHAIGDACGFLLAAASQGNAEAAFELAGQLSAQEHADALTGHAWLAVAAAHAHPQAARMLGGMDFGRSPLRMSSQQRLHLLAAAVAVGDLEAHAILATKLLEQASDGAPDLHQVASRLLRSGIERGSPHCHFALGAHLLSGCDSASARARAIAHLRKAAASGMEDAKVPLARAYMKGQGVPKAVMEGVRMLREAAHAGCTAAMFDLARHLDKAGRQAEALAWFEQAASIGHAPASYMAGYLLLKQGLGGKHRALAKSYIQRAASAGYEPALRASSSKQRTAVQEDASTPKGMLTKPASKQKPAKLPLALRASPSALRAASDSTSWIAPSPIKVPKQSVELEKTRTSPAMSPPLERDAPPVRLQSAPVQEEHTECLAPTSALIAFRSGIQAWSVPCSCVAPLEWHETDGAPHVRAAVARLTDTAQSVVVAPAQLSQQKVHLASLAAPITANDTVHVASHQQAGASTQQWQSSIVESVIPPGPSNPDFQVEVRPHSGAAKEIISLTSGRIRDLAGHVWGSWVVGDTVQALIHRHTGRLLDAGDARTGTWLTGNITEVRHGPGGATFTVSLTSGRTLEASAQHLRHCKGWHAELPAADFSVGDEVFMPIIVKGRFRGQRATVSGVYTVTAVASGQHALHVFYDLDYPGKSWSELLTHSALVWRPKMRAPQQEKQGSAEATTDGVERVPAKCVGGGSSDHHRSQGAGKRSESSNPSSPLARRPPSAAQMPATEKHTRQLQNQDASSAALALLVEKSAAGDAQASFELAEAYSHGRLGAPPSETTANELYKTASAQGCVEAHCKVAELLLGTMGEASAPEAIRLLHEAAKNGITHAQVMLADCYERGRGMLSPDLAMARDLFEKAAAAGSATALLRTGKAWLSGEWGGLRSFSKGFKRLQLAHQAGSCEAAMHIAAALLEGPCPLSDLSQVLKLLDEAAQGGHQVSPLFAKALEISKSSGQPNEDALAALQRLASAGDASAKRELLRHSAGSPKHRTGEQVTVAYTKGAKKHVFTGRVTQSAVGSSETDQAVFVYDVQLDKGGILRRLPETTLTAQSSTQHRASISWAGTSTQHIASSGKGRAVRRHSKTVPGTAQAAPHMHSQTESSSAKAALSGRLKTPAVQQAS